MEYAVHTEYCMYSAFEYVITPTTPGPSTKYCFDNGAAAPGNGVEELTMGLSGLDF